MGLSLNNNHKKTYDELAEEYADEVELDSNTYRGDVVTAFVMGMMKRDELRQKEKRANKSPYLGKNPLDKYPHPFDPKTKSNKSSEKEYDKIMSDARKIFQKR